MRQPAFSERKIQFVQDVAGITIPPVLGDVAVSAQRNVRWESKWRDLESLRRIMSGQFDLDVNVIVRVPVVELVVPPIRGLLRTTYRCCSPLKPSGAVLRHSSSVIGRKTYPFISSTGIEPSPC